MLNIWLWFWTAMIFLSILWYAVLLFYVGVRGGSEIVQLTQNLTRRTEENNDAP